MGDKPALWRDVRKRGPVGPLVSGSGYVGDAVGKDDKESDGLTDGLAVISNSWCESEWLKETNGWADNDGR